MYDSTTGTSDKSSVHLIVQQDTLGGFMEGSGDTGMFPCSDMSYLSLIAL